MRAELSKSAEDKWSDVDVGYNSAIWEEHVAASEVFIVPTVVTGQGTRRLLTIANQGIIEFTTKSEELRLEANVVACEQLRARLNCAFTITQQRQSLGPAFDEEQVHGHAQLVMRRFELQTSTARRALSLAEQLAVKFDQVRKVAGSILAEQEERGDQITQTELGLKKLTIGMKCMDTVWADIIHSSVQLKKVQEVFNESRISMVPSEMSPWRTGEIQSGEIDDEGNDNDHHNPQQVVIFDPTSMLSRPGSSLRLDPVPEDDEAEYPMPPVSSPTNDGSTLVDAFEEKCQISSDCSSTGDPPALASNKAKTRDHHGDDGSLPDTVQEEDMEASGLEPRAEGVTKANSKGEAPSQDEYDNDSDELDIICSAPSSPYPDPQLETTAEATIDEDNHELKRKITRSEN